MTANISEKGQELSNRDYFGFLKNKAGKWRYFYKRGKGTSGNIRSNRGFDIKKSGRINLLRVAKQQQEEKAQKLRSMDQGQKCNKR